jgi:hypothetical protein
VVTDDFMVEHRAAQDADSFSIRHARRTIGFKREPRRLAGKSRNLIPEARTPCGGKEFRCHSRFGQRGGIRMLNYPDSID